MQDWFLPCDKIGPLGYLHIACAVQHAICRLGRPLEQPAWPPIDRTIASNGREASLEVGESFGSLEIDNINNGGVDMVAARGGRLSCAEVLCFTSLHPVFDAWAFACMSGGGLSNGTSSLFRGQGSGEYIQGLSIRSRIIV
jgi:hypothetical protein